MHSLKGSFILFLLAGIMFGCGYAAPKVMPDNFSINYQLSGGMRPTYQTIELKVGECKIESKLNFDDSVSISHFQLKREDLEPLYNQLYSIKAFTLKSRTEKVYDRGGESIGYQIDKKFYTVSNSGMSFIIAAHAKAFEQSVLFIKTFADKHRQ